MYAELMLKNCAVCKEDKLITDFYVRKASKDGLARLCKECEIKRHAEYRSDGTKKSSLSMQQKAWRAKNKDRIAKQKRKHKLGIEPDLQDKLLKDQGHCCAICGIQEKKLRRRLALDHDHSTGAIREFLCDTCNRCLGLLKDRVEILESAILYLKKHQK